MCRSRTQQNEPNQGWGNLWSCFSYNTINVTYQFSWQIVPAFHSRYYPHLPAVNCTEESGCAYRLWAYQRNQALCTYCQQYCDQTLALRLQSCSQWRRQRIGRISMAGLDSVRNLEAVKNSTDYSIYNCWNFLLQSYEFVLRLVIEKELISTEWRKTKVITTANQKRGKYQK